MALKGSREIGKLELKVPFKEGLSAPDFQAQKVSPDGEISKCGTLFSGGAGTRWTQRAGDPLGTIHK